MVVSVFEYLAFADLLLGVSLVCRYWLRLSSSNYLWTQISKLHNVPQPSSTSSSSSSASSLSAHNGTSNNKHGSCKNNFKKHILSIQQRLDTEISQLTEKCANAVKKVNNVRQRISESEYNAQLAAAGQSSLAVSLTSVGWSVQSADNKLKTMHDVLTSLNNSNKQITSACQSLKQTVSALHSQVSGLSALQQKRMLIRNFEKLVINACCCTLSSSTLSSSLSPNNHKNQPREQPPENNNTTPTAQAHRVFANFIQDFFSLEQVCCLQPSSCMATRWSQFAKRFPIDANYYAWRHQFLHEPSAEQTTAIELLIAKEEGRPTNNLQLELVSQSDSALLLDVANVSGMSLEAFCDHYNF
eukprot:TRINITY_DN65800_c3_g1_i1.p1 TRINITY_DN65800_c3_g1~~TRINITY_DN65800_c3_g1_i1.p1  ORF type:complete len:357 (+),score=39.12 TRINITY_DN65800_c3_g1_i1:308-1378(+)